MVSSKVREDVTAERVVVRVQECVFARELGRGVLLDLLNELLVLLALVRRRVPRSVPGEDLCKGNVTPFGNVRRDFGFRLQRPIGAILAPDSGDVGKTMIPFADRGAPRTPLGGNCGTRAVAPVNGLVS